MRLSVIVPTMNERDTIARCVESAFALGAVEVVVADGGSDDGTQELAEQAGALVVPSDPGRGVQMNTGAAAVTGDVLLFLHADTWLMRDASKQIDIALSDPATMHGAFRQQIEHGASRYRWLEAGNAYRARRLGVPYGDQALFVRRDAFDRVGGFPDEPLMEDVVIARRLRSLGRPVLLDGPIYVSARRWQCNGVVRQTIKNWTLLVAWKLGVSPSRLAKWYYATPTSAPTITSPGKAERQTPSPAMSPAASSGP